MGRSEVTPMTSRNPHPLFTQILYGAAGSPRGVFVRTPNVENLRSQLYITRTALADDDLSKLVIRLSPRDPKGEIWIINTRPDEAQHDPT